MNMNTLIAVLIFFDVVLPVVFGVVFFLAVTRVGRAADPDKWHTEIGDYLDNYRADLAYWADSGVPPLPPPLPIGGLPPEIAEKWIADNYEALRLYRQATEARERKG